jgi:AraC-like DNA-binding protein
LLYGLGPYAYLRQYRLQKAKDLLIRTEKNILEIANSVGYANPSKFSCAFKRVFGLSPLKYRKLQQL